MLLLNLAFDERSSYPDMTRIELYLSHPHVLERIWRVMGAAAGGRWVSRDLIA